MWSDYLKNSINWYLSFSKSIFAANIKIWKTISNETYFTKPMFIVLNPNELQYYPILVKLDRYRGSCNTLDDLSDKLNVANKTEYVNVNIFNVIKWTNE